LMYYNITAYFIFFAFTAIHQSLYECCVDVLFQNFHQVRVQLMLTALVTTMLFVLIAVSVHVELVIMLSDHTVVSSSDVFVFPAALLFSVVAVAHFLWLVGFRGKTVVSVRFRFLVNAGIE